MALEVMGQLHRDGLHLLVILPDGSRSLIPVGWTDLAAGQRPAVVVPGNLGALAELLQARAIVNALLDRLAPLRDEVPAATVEETLRATDLGVSQRAQVTFQPVGPDRSRSSHRRHRGPGAVARPSCPRRDTGGGE